MKVLLLAGGISNEHDVSVRSGKSIAQALDELIYDYSVSDPSAADFDLASLSQGVDVVFLALHGEGGEDGAVQTELEILGKAYTGSDSNASALCFDKWAYKEKLEKAGLPVTSGALVSKKHKNHELFNLPFVLKPIKGGSSLDTLIARNADDTARAKAGELLEKYDKMLLEPLIAGTEITVGVFGEKALPIIEIIPPDGLEFDYENKYNGATQELCPPQNVSEDVQQEAKALALQIHQLTGCRHMSRTDMIVDSNNNLWILETNTIPGLTAQSLLPKMLNEAGYTLPTFVDTLLHSALNSTL